MATGYIQDISPRSTLHVHQPEAADARSLSDQAYFRIRELIVSLKLPPGAILDERELMDRLGVGRTPVREALRALAREQLVEVYPRRGIAVTGIDLRDLASLAEVRLALETLAAGLAADRATAEDRAECAELLDELERAAGENDERALIELDQRIHRHVYRCAHNPHLERTLEEHYVLSLRIWFLALERVARLEDAVREHRELLTAIRAGERERAEDVMRRHVAGFERAIREVL
jgi:DNA-binding GntR family transcriptional regulator